LLFSQPSPSSRRNKDRPNSNNTNSTHLGIPDSKSKKDKSAKKSNETIAGHGGGNAPAASTLNAANNPVRLKFLLYSFFYMLPFKLILGAFLKEKCQGHWYKSEKGRENVAQRFESYLLKLLIYCALVRV
jgi:hypothetical protein